MPVFAEFEDGPGNLIPSAHFNDLAEQENNIASAVAELEGRVVPTSAEAIGARQFNYRYWNPTTSTWSARPSVPVGMPVIAESPLHPAATAPPGASVGDVWLPHYSTIPSEIYIPPPDPDPEPEPEPPPPGGTAPLTGPAGTLTWRWVGGTSEASTVITTKTSGCTQVRALVSQSPTLSTGAIYSNIATPDANGISRLTVTGLNAATGYYYGIECGPILNTTKQGLVRTFPSGAASFLIAASSCLKSTGSSALNRILGRNPALFIHLGDLWYDDGASTSPDSYRSHYDEMLGITDFGNLFAKVPSAYTWSDHDFGMNNNTVGTSDSTRTANAQAVWHQYVPHWSKPTTTGINQTFVIGRVRFIITDNRSFKSSLSASDNSSKTVLGTAQKAWWKTQITDSAQKVIIWANEHPWVGPTTSGEDEWMGYNTERQELAAHALASGKQLFIISGDSHMIAFDNGTNSAGSIPVFHCSPLYQAASIKGGPYSGGTYPTSEGSTVQQYGVVEFTDTGGSTITVNYRGYDSNNTERKSYTRIVTV